MDNLSDMLTEDIKRSGKITEEGIELKSADGKTTKLPFKVFTKKNQAKEFNDIQPLFYDRYGMFWLWNIKKTK